MVTILLWYLLGDSRIFEIGSTVVKIGFSHDETKTIKRDKKTMMILFEASWFCLVLAVAIAKTPIVSMENLYILFTLLYH